MNHLRKVLSVAVVSAVLTAGSAFAQDHYVRHDEWHKGAKINQSDWNRGAQVDWHAHHLQSPPNGYQWRQVDGNYVLAAAATGLIAATIIASTH
jgi:Ni/Co efflux regulator RcnB